MPEENNTNSNLENRDADAPVASAEAKVAEADGVGEEARQAVEEEKKVREKARGLIRWVRGFSTDSMDDRFRSDGGLRGDVRSVVSAFQQFPVRAIGDLQFEYVQAIHDLAEKVRNVLDKSTKRPGWTEGGRDEWEEGIKNAIRDKCATWISQMQQYKAIAAHPEVGVLIEALTQKQKDADNLVAELTQQKEKADAIVADITKASEAKTLWDQLPYFKEEADEHEKKASEWLLWVVVSSLALGGFALISGLFSGAPVDGVHLVQMLANKGIFFVTLGYGVFFCTKNYMAHRHNAVINRHRQKALDAFHNMVAADPASKAIVLAHAARCVYAPYNSGYARGGDVKDSGNVVENFLRPAENIVPSEKKED